MSLTLLILVTVAYAGIAVSEATSKNYGMAVVFTGYAFANVGLMMGLA